MTKIRSAGLCWTAGPKILRRYCRTRSARSTQCLALSSVIVVYIIYCVPCNHEEATKRKKNDRGLEFQLDIVKKCTESASFELLSDSSCRSPLRGFFRTGGPAEQDKTGQNLRGLREALRW